MKDGKTTFLNNPSAGTASIDMSKGKLVWSNYYNLDNSSDFYSISSSIDKDHNIYSFVLSVNYSGTTEMIVKYDSKGKRIGEGIIIKNL